MIEITLQSSQRTEFIEITEHIENLAAKNKIANGICHVFVPHTTAAVTINENADPDVIKDITTALDKIAPWKNNYSHNEGNSAAHIKASLMGFSQNVIISSGRIALGTWQGIFFTEFDGPRTRKVWVEFTTNVK